MAPAPTATANRPMAAPSKTRYFKGKAPEAMADSDSDEDEDVQKPIVKEPIKVDKSLVAGGAGRIITDVSKIRQRPQHMGVKMELGSAKIGTGAPVKAEESESEEESEEEEEEAPPVKPKFGLPKPAEEDESSEYETDSEEEEEEKKPAFRPVFVKKDLRGMTQEKAAAEAEARIKAEEELQAQRIADSKDLAGETIKRELLEREVKDLQPDVDDTDGLDPAGEFEAWRARELRRLVRDKEAQAARDMEREEIERRRALPEEQRLREDLEYAQSTRDREKGEMGFLQKYYHKGAFHQDDELLNRDYTAATENAVDMTNLPAVLQVRDYGKRSRTKYTHLVDQDTSQGGWGAAVPIPPPGAAGQAGKGIFAAGCFNCGGPHMRKDCPNNNINDPMVQMGLAAPGSSTGGYGRGGNGQGGPPQDYGHGGSRSNRYRDEGKERRFEDARREDNYFDDNRGGRRERSRSPRRRDDGYRRDDRGGERRRDDRDRERDRDKDRGDRRDDRRRDDRDRDRDRRR